ncbi:MAG: LysR family transcriptional regulator [Peptococcaceae bacterium]|nr:LysR family transcriptional regulator [Peptococcaceae bacterium]
MNTDQMLLLIDLAQTLSFNKTAERLFTTQQNVSYKVKQLERELHIRIFIRSNSGVEFTSEGEYVLQCAYEMEKAYQTLREKLLLDGSKHKNNTNMITLYISSVLLSSKMTMVIKKYKKEFPQCKLLIKEVSTNQILHSLFTHKCDFAFWSINEGYFEPHQIECNEKGITSEIVNEDHAIAVISKESELAGKKTLSIRDLTHKPKSIFGMLPLDYFGKDTDSFVLYENNNIDIHKQLIKEENVICFTSQMIYDQLFAKEEFIAKPFDYPTLPIQHIILKRNIVENSELTVLSNIIKGII